MTPKKTRPSRREEYSAATRSALIAAARETFSERGFVAATLEDVAARARVTRGALYHHFQDKTALFDAVVQELQTESAVAIEASARQEPHIRMRIHRGMDAYLDQCLKPEFRRIVIELAPAILGSQRYREIEETSSLRLVIATLDALVHRRELACEDTALLGRMIDALCCEVALLLPAATDTVALRRTAHALVERTLRGFEPAARGIVKRQRRSSDSKGTRR